MGKHQLSISEAHQSYLEVRTKFKRTRVFRLKAEIYFEEMF